MIKKIFSSTLMLTAFVVADGMLVKTGQVKSYDAGGSVVSNNSVKDDGYYQKGIKRNYIRSNGVVTDKATSLQWQDNINSVERELSSAMSYCTALSLGGHTDWRLPSIHELLTIVDSSKYNYSVTEGVFKHISSPNSYLSSTNVERYSGYTWAIDFRMGYTKYGSGSNYVRCVRGNQFKPSTFSRNDKTEIVTDHTTGLQWQDDDTMDSGSGKWISAINYCEKLTLGKHNDWRLPNRNELHSILDYSQQGFYTEFLNRDGGKFWSSTTRSKSKYAAWSIDFSDGKSNYSKKFDKRYVRCVRGEPSYNAKPTPTPTPFSSLIPAIMFIINE